MAVASRRNFRALRRDNLCVARSDLRLASKIHDHAAAKVARYRHDRAITGAVKLNVLRLDFDALERRQINRNFVGNGECSRGVKQQPTNDPRHKRAAGT